MKIDSSKSVAASKSEALQTAQWREARAATKRYKRYKHYTFESKESSTMLFSAITPYFLPLYSLLFGILYAIFPCV